MRRVAIVGAGLGGLSAAIHLALKGVHVEIFEQAANPGGKASEHRLGGFRFDTGPSLVTMAMVWDELFAAAGRRREDYLKLTRLDPIAEYFWPRDRLTAPGTPEGLARAFAVRGWAPEPATLGFLDHARGLWELAGPLFLRHSLHDRSTWTLPETWSTLFRAGQLDSRRTLRQAIEERFQDPRVRQFFGRYATYNGSDPRRLPATFAMIPWVEYGLGAWSADEGIHAIPRSMQRLAVELGVTVHLSTPVQAIVHERGRIKGLSVGARGKAPEFVAFDAVVSNADVSATYRLLESGGPTTRRQRSWGERYRRGEPSSSGVVFLWGINRSHPELGLHNVFFSPDYDEEFRSLFQERTLPVDPTVYVNITSKTTRADAPPGQENWFVLVNTPHDPGLEQLDDGALTRLRAATLKRVESNLGRPVEPHIVQEAVLPLGTSLYGLASHRALAAFDRHPNRAPAYRGLYVCGGSAHPGGGMPLAVLSGRIAAQLAAKDLKA